MILRVHKMTNQPADKPIIPGQNIRRALVDLSLQPNYADCTTVAQMNDADHRGKALYLGPHAYHPHPKYFIDLGGNVYRLGNDHRTVIVEVEN